MEVGPSSPLQTEEAPKASTVDVAAAVVANTARAAKNTAAAAGGGGGEAPAAVGAAIRDGGGNGTMGSSVAAFAAAAATTAATVVSTPLVKTWGLGFARAVGTSPRLAASKLSSGLLMVTGLSVSVPFASFDSMIAIRAPVCPVAEEATFLKCSLVRSPQSVLSPSLRGGTATMPSAGHWGPNSWCCQAEASS